MVLLFTLQKSSFKFLKYITYDTVIQCILLLKYGAEKEGR